MISDFEDLVIYQKAREQVKKVYEITRKGDFKFDTRFVQQIRAAAGSVSDNIAEGFERQGNKEFKNFLYIAKGSNGEVRSQLNRAFDVGFVDEETYHSMYDDCKRLSISILHFIESLKLSDVKGSRYKDSNILNGSSGSKSMNSRYTDLKDQSNQSNNSNQSITF